MKLLYHNVFHHCQPTTSGRCFTKCGRMFQLHSSGHYHGNYYTGSNGTGTLLHADLIEKVEPIIFLAVLIQRPVPNNLASSP
jgi:hypothetical protein